MYFFYSHLGLSPGDGNIANATPRANTAIQTRRVAASLWEVYLRRLTENQGFQPT